MKVTLAQALQMRKDLNAEIGTLCNERAMASSVITYENDENFEIYRKQQLPVKSVEELTKLIEEKRQRLATLQNLIDRENTSSLTDWKENGEYITINQLWLLNNNIKAELAFSMSAGSHVQKNIKKGRRYTSTSNDGRLGFISDPDTVYEMPYNVSQQQERAKKLEKKYRATNDALRKANWNTEIDIPWEEEEDID